MKRKPLIGISMRLDNENGRFYIGRDYCEALEHFGAAPVLVPLIPKREYISGIIENFDGILLPGSDTDVDPEYFGENPHPRLKKVNPEKDETDLLLLEEAEKIKLPVLAICFGMQILNVARGGSLYQDIETMIPNCLKHEQGIPLERNSHQIKVVEEDSLIRSVFLPDDRKTIKVNSHHHQAINKLGNNLKATAYAPDGVVECIEDTRKDRWVLGVEWHPELAYRKDDSAKRIFESFVNFCISGRK